MSHESSPAAAAIEGREVSGVVRSPDGELGLILVSGDQRSYLRIGDAAWRLRVDERTVDGSANETDGDSPVDRLLTTTVSSVDVSQDVADTRIAFSDGSILEILATSSRHPVWYWFDSPESVLTVGPASAWSAGPVPEHLADVAADGFGGP